MSLLAPAQQPQQPPQGMFGGLEQQLPAMMYNHKGQLPEPGDTLRQANAEAQAFAPGLEHKTGGLFESLIQPLQGGGTGNIDADAPLMDSQMAGVGPQYSLVGQQATSIPATLQALRGMQAASPRNILDLLSGLTV